MKPKEWKSSLPPERLKELQAQHTGYVSATELAKEFGVTVSCIYRWGALGKFPRSIKLCGSARWHRATVAAWLEEQEQHSLEEETNK